MMILINEMYLKLNVCVLCMWFDVACRVEWEVWAEWEVWVEWVEWAVSCPSDDMHRLFS